MHVAKTKALISFAVTAKLICFFVFAYAYCWISHAAAQNGLHIGYSFLFLMCLVETSRQELPSCL